MVRTTKPTTTTTATTTATTSKKNVPLLSIPIATDSAVLENSVVPATAPTVKKTKVPKNTVVTEPIVTETKDVEAHTQDVSDSEVVEGEESIANKMVDFNSKLLQLVGFISSLKGQFKGLEKVVNREIKAAVKASSKKSKRSGNRQPSGFVRPTLISDELSDFLGKVHGSEMARTEVSREINKYIRLHNLQDKGNGRQINADDKLTTLLKLSKDDVLTYFNLQKYMKHHFIKTVPVPVTV
jgi:chromatin remodeling complex protein RSC6